ncbi:MAG TPA: EamA family transporter, partial [Solirubrobacter sp.]
MIGAALLASLLWGTADFLGGQASRKHPAAMVAFVGQAIGFFALALILVFHGVDAKAIVPGLVTGLLGAVAVLCFYRALAVGTMSIIAPVVATSATVPVLWGVLHGERPGTLQWIGIVAALAGVI